MVWSESYSSMSEIGDRGVDCGGSSIYGDERMWEKRWMVRLYGRSVWASVNLESKGGERRWWNMWMVKVYVRGVWASVNLQQ